MRSSIRSRSTSQYLSDDRRSLSISSAWADSLSSSVSGCNVSERLLNFRGVRFNFNVRHLACFGLGASINHSPLVNPLLLMCSYHNAVAVVPKSFGSSHSGRPRRPETSARDFALGLRTAGGTSRYGVSSQRAGRPCGFTRRTQASQILRIERAESRRNSRPDPNDPFFHAWHEQRDPKFAAKK